MNATGKRLGFALLFTGTAVTINVYVVLTGSAENFYEDVTNTLLRDGTQIVDARRDLNRQLQSDDCTWFASATVDHLPAASHSSVECAEQTAIGI